MSLTTLEQYQGWGSRVADAIEDLKVKRTDVVDKSVEVGEAKGAVSAALLDLDAKVGELDGLIVAWNGATKALALLKQELDVVLP